MSAADLYVQHRRSMGRSRWKVRVHDQHGFEVDCHLWGPRLNADGERMPAGWASSWHRFDEGQEVGNAWTRTDGTLTLDEALALFDDWPDATDALRSAVAGEVAA